MPVRERNADQKQDPVIDSESTQYRLVVMKHTVIIISEIIKAFPFLFCGISQIIPLKLACRKIPAAFVLGAVHTARR